METGVGASGELVLLKQGAEAKLYTCDFLGKPAIVKERFPKSYRHPVLDKSLTLQRTKSEVRSMQRCRTNGIRTPAIYFVDMEEHKIYMEHVKDSITIKDYIRQTQKEKKEESLPVLEPLVEKIGTTLAKMHDKNIIHGDLTTSNMLLQLPVENHDLVLIDFGLGYLESISEDKGVDLYVLERAFLSTHPNTEDLFNLLLNSYIKHAGKSADEVIKKLGEVRMRGRKRTMVG